MSLDGLDFFLFGHKSNWTYWTEEEEGCWEACMAEQASTLSVWHQQGNFDLTEQLTRSLIARAMFMKVQIWRRFFRIKNLVGDASPSSADIDRQNQRLRHEI